MFLTLARIAAVVFLPVICWAAPYKVVAAGDSITAGYLGGDTSFRLQDCLTSLGVSAQITNSGISGATAQYWISKGGLSTLDQHPDAVVLMLGTNDAASSSWSPAGYEQSYYTAMTTIFTALDASTNDRGGRTAVVLMTIIPVVEANLNTSVNYASTINAITNQFNPWLQEQATARGYHLMDINALIQSQPNWQSMYNDGVHLWGDNQRGYNVMAGAVASAVAASVPEPLAASMIGISVLALGMRRRCR